ncbi:histidine phosphatase family protein [Paenibacillus sp. NEAU-GSW1]|uniref:histidine phosphatase family protein n=1 Tax=Paenibacillus sp. NEAU-GSW1 TaxID=2682486 RepID=UPI0012E1FCFD|nr:histidine phosphatase family protein [Paenibacillus sp. NEAU-GSW1]MUT64740.1 histidine phosphatase family protein [Paenibacillus sp. NEAU-GSW1]
MKTTIYMVRHAESPFEFGQERTRGLSEEGFIAAKRVAQFFETIKIDHIASSSYTRAKQTVQYIAEQKSLDIFDYEGLIERPIKGLDYKASWDVLEEAIRRSFADKDFSLKGGESTRKAQERSIPIIESFLEKREGESIVIGTHGNIMTIIMNYYDTAYGFDFWKSTSKPDIYKLTFDRNQLELVERIWIQ